MTRKSDNTAKSLVRRTATALTAVSFLGVGLTGLLMTVSIGGHALNGVHVVLGVAFVVAAVLHVVKNGKAMMKVASRRPAQLFFGAVAAATVVAVLMTGSGPERRGPRSKPGAPLVEANATAPTGALAEAGTPAAAR